MGKSKFLVLATLVYLLNHDYLWSQEHRFMVFFEQKNSSFTVDNPEAFLSSRAIERRNRQSIPVIEEDLPVSEAHISGLQAMGITIWYTTKWFNGALIQTDSSKLNDIQALPFVSSLEMVAPGPLLTESEKEVHPKNRLNAGSRTQSTEIQNRILGVDEMQQEGFRGQGILIGVFDDGFLGVDQASAFSHLDQNNQLKLAYDFVGNSDNIYRYDDHGTKVLSVIGANEPGSFTGSAFDAEFILCVTEDVSSEYRIEEYNWLFAAEMADSAGVDIINTSLGYSNFDDPSMNYQKQDLDGNTAAISRAAAIAASKGIVLTISAGNEGNSAWQTITTPADIENALAVGAINDDSVKASFSSTGPTADGRIKPDVVALGVNAAVVNRNGLVVFNNGTSFSAPQIAGLAAGIWQANPDLTALEIIQALKESSHQFQNANSETGYGIPNYLNTKVLVLSTDDLIEDDLIKLYPNPAGNLLFLLSHEAIPHLTFFIHNLSGQAIVEQTINNIPANTAVAIDISTLSKDIYLITVVAEAGAESFRIIRK